MSTILIVEDEFLVAMNLEHIVSAAGYEVVGVAADSSQAEAVPMPPAVALVDLNLRDGPTGNAVAQKLAERFGTRIVFVTANPAQIQSVPATAVGYVQKPFCPERILQAIDLALNDDTSGGSLRAIG